MKNNKKKGFTLVELLAVIVILAIILVIAVPKIMETIKNAKIGSMESSAKLIAKSVETNYQVSLASGEGGTLSLTGSCLDAKIADIDLNEYESCTYTITDGKAKVTLKGKSTGKFSGLTCTDATKTTATCTSEDNGNNTLTGNAAEVLISQLDNNIGLEKIEYDSDWNEKDSTNYNGTVEYTEYRYTGATPKNYVTFNGETWRIIGIFDNQLKLIRDESIGDMIWDAGNDNTWIGSDIQLYLTGTYYSSLTSTAQNMVNTSAIFNTGGFAFSSLVTTSKAYTSEKTDSNSTMKVGLMTPSDYGYAALSSCRNNYYVSYNSSVNDYRNSTCTSNNWMYKDDNTYCTMTRGASYSGYAWGIGSAGGAGYSDVRDEHAVRPVVYLKSSIQITGGSGTSTEPYTLE